MGRSAPFTLLCFLCFASALASAAPAADFAPSPVIVGYVFPQDAMLAPDQIDAGRLTRANYAFANIKDGRIVPGFAHDTENFATLTGLRRTHPHFSVLVSVGGWTWSGHFSDVALTSQSRAVFIESVIAFLKQYDLDGLDIDWEYPGQTGDNNRFRPEDKQNYTLLLKELRARFDVEGKAMHRHLYLTIAAAGTGDWFEHTEMGEVQKYVDTINLMAYDYYEPASDKTTGNHAPLFTDPADPKKISADASLKLYEQAQVPPGKIVLGVPFYGHVWGQVPAANHGLFQPGKPVPEAYANYTYITQNMLDKGYTRYWDQAAAVPYLYNAEKKIFVSYEDPQSLTAKSRYVLEHKLAGVMFWDYTGDPSGKLLTVIDTTLHKGATAQTENK